MVVNSRTVQKKVKPQKDTVGLRLLKHTRAKLREAAASIGLTQSSYVELALIDRFKRDGMQ
jgi:hypothetical protein